MRRYVILLLALLPLSLSMSAQKHYVPHIHVGVHGGMSLGQQSFSPSIKQGFHKGFIGGVSVRYAEERHVGILCELNLEQRGWSEDFEGAPFSYERTLTYVELPILTHIFFGSRVVKGFINLGPQLCYMIGDNVKANFDYMNPAGVAGFPLRNRHVEQMKMDVSNKFDYGITAGAGVEFVIRRKHSVTLEGRYYYGLGNIYPSNKKDYFSASRGSSIMITLGYMFRLK